MCMRCLLRFTVITVVVGILWTYQYLFEIKLVYMNKFRSFPYEDKTKVIGLSRTELQLYVEIDRLF